ncbi:adenosylcobinamide-GDP ribazoletransferase [Streptomyces sp. H10-C2]|uniref:adenosylcobinamide-GDP ribazoletransferase n=1 Tax=unclassified Streptomyces TaxID=2593676 RepID=UPI0024BBC774|nr:MULTISPECIES: adenosylcobinamide-GDP ribazoletransferase [unclassified Streptomyces]MDJ0341170.1 adenosylcobinamide-GDP ribazoletransferase [Streptomyces sp. PH10-H1]MDJ0369477.1 adenosylcobinamide-GDP ribazoletransferase [Streptomyces sp. H10-C2]
MRFAFGTLTVLPVAVGRWDRSAARGGMLCAPLVGAVAGLSAAAAGGLLLLLGASPLLAAVATAAVPAALTRGLHLDGLADTADGLGSGKPAEDALRIMKQSDIGPFGVLTLLFVLLTQVACLATLYTDSWSRGAAAAAVSAVVARTAMTLACRDGVPPARPDGLGAAVAGAVPLRTAGLTAAATVAVSAAAGLLFGPSSALHFGLAALIALAAAELLLRHCRTRFGGVTGDVFGALCETAATAVLVVLSLG